MRIAVSGAAGYVGNVLCRHLTDCGHKVVGMDNLHKGDADPLLGIAHRTNFSFFKGNVANKEDCKKLVEGADAIIHLAAIVGFPACKADPSLSYLVNVTGTTNMLEARHKDQKFVFASTGSVYGKIEAVCTEDSPLNAQSLYGVHKRVAEQSVSFNDNTVSFRFATGFGLSPCMRVNLLVNDFVYQATNNGCLTVFQADARRTFIHVQDMARAFAFGATTPLKHKVYNCGSDYLNWTKRELAECVKNKTNCVVNYNEFATDPDQRDYEVDYSRINNEGFHCDHTCMEDSVDELIKAMPIMSNNKYN
jgi:nucleoside-diphosphate-sugar epimerase